MKAVLSLSYASAPSEDFNTAFVTDHTKYWHLCLKIFQNVLSRDATGSEYEHRLMFLMWKV